MPFEFEPEPERAAARPGRLNWVWGLVGLVLGAAGFFVPQILITPLWGALAAGIGLSRYNRLRRFGAGGRAIAIVGLVVSLASLSYLVLGLNQIMRLGSLLGR